MLQTLEVILDDVDDEGIRESCEGIDIDKEYQKTDWKKRPLTQGMIDYAAIDAEILIKLYDRFSSVIETLKTV